MGLTLLALTLTASMSLAQPGPDQAAVQASADFVCHGFVTQSCHFAILRQNGTRIDFALTSGQTRHVTDIAPGVDRYMVMVNDAPPERTTACSRTPASGKRSAWCKLSPISAQLND